MIALEDKSKTRVFNNRYFIKKRISAGSFGVVFLCSDLIAKEPVAMKVEKDDANTCMSLDREIQILSELKNVAGVPKLLWAGSEHGHNCLVLQLLGRDLSYHIKNLKKFSLKCVVNIGVQILHIIESIHRKGIIHRDLKPENVMTGRDLEQNVIYLSDFGISKFYKEPTGTHIPLKENKPFVGTTRYASLQAHRGVELSRRDDLESLGYMLVYLLKGQLPWQTAHNLDETQKNKYVGNIKLKTSLEDLCQGLPLEFIQYFQYVRQQQFKATPDYRYLQQLFEQIAKQNGFFNDKRFDWTEQGTTSTSKAHIQDNSQGETKLSRQMKHDEQHKHQKTDSKQRLTQSRNKSKQRSVQSMQSGESGSSSYINTAQQSSVFLNYQNSQMSQSNVRLGSSKLLSKLSDRPHFQKHTSSRGSQMKIPSQKSVIADLVKDQPSQFIQLAKDDFEDLEDLEEILKKDKNAKKSRPSHNFPLKVKQVAAIVYDIKDNTNMTGLNYMDDDEGGLDQKIQTIQKLDLHLRFKEDLAKY